MLPPSHQGPRQKPKHKGVVVYSTETPEGTENTDPVRAAMLREAKASVALDGETQVIEGPSEMKVSEGDGVRRSNDKPKEQTMGSSRLGTSNKMPYGDKQGDVDFIIRQLAREGHLSVHPASILSHFNQETRIKWHKAYKTKTRVLAQIASALNSICHSGENGKKYHEIEMSGDQDGIYLIKGIRTTSERPPVKKLKAASLPVSQEATDNITPHGVGHLTVIGTDNAGNTLYLDPTTNVIGTVGFTPVGKSR